MTYILFLALVLEVPCYIVEFGLLHPVYVQQYLHHVAVLLLHDILQLFPILGQFLGQVLNVLAPPHNVHFFLLYLLSQFGHLLFVRCDLESHLVVLAVERFLGHSYLGKEIFELIRLSEECLQVVLAHCEVERIAIRVIGWGVTNHRGSGKVLRIGRIWLCW